MEGKLIKQEKEYYALYNTEGIFISDVNGGSLANRLSLKNCQAIENGYDLDELAEEEAKKRHDWNKHRDTDIYNELVRDDAELIKIGFQKAVEILGDKKFSESNLRIGCSSLLNLEKEEGELSEVFTEKQYRHIDNYIQSLQQTKWDVEIEMWFHGTRHKKGEWISKLDADGCLILKRK